MLVALAGSPCPARAQGASFADRLQRADVLRSGNQREFSQLISQMELESGTATRAQRQHLALLQAYRLTLAGNTAASIEKLETLLAEGPSPVIQVRAGALLANNYAIAGKFVEGAGLLERTLDRLDDIDDRDARHQALTTAAILYNLMGQYPLGRRFAERVLADQPGDRLRCFAENLRLESLLETNASPPVDVFERAIGDCARLQEQVVVGFARSYLARKLHADGQTQRAIATLEANLPELKATGYPRVLAEVYALLARYQFEAGQAGVARAYAEQAIDLADQPASLAAAHNVLYRIAEQRGDIGAALEHYRAYAEADKAHSSQANAREMAYQVVRQESRNKSQQIALLNRQNEVLKLQQQVDRQAARNMTVLAALAALLVGVIGYWAYRVKRMEHVLRLRSEVDALTGVSSRQHFTGRVQRLLSRDMAHGVESALVMFDLDNFKACNDRHGHETGDQVLVRAARACRSACRPDDLIGRLGGEEFAIFLPATGQDEAMRVAEACRRALEATGLGIEACDTEVTASFGVAMASMSGHDLTAMLSRADKALYRAKHEGRNRVRAYDDSMAGEIAAPRLRLVHPPAPTASGA